jgi:hypothetical protein
MEAARDQGRGEGSARVASWMAWSLWALSVGLTVLSLLLLVLNHSHPDVHVYDYWLENTLSAVLFSTVGAIVASRRAENPVGWLFCLLGLAFSIGHFSSQYAIYAQLAQPDLLPAGQALAWISSWILPPIIGLQVFSFLLFPTGRLPSRRWMWLAWLTVASAVVGTISSAFSFGANGGLGPVQNPLGIEGFSNVYDAVLTFLTLLTVPAALSPFARLRRAGGVERQQIKWFAYAAAATVGGLALAYMIPNSIDTALVRVGRVCASHRYDTGNPRLHRDRHITLPSLRHRPHHQPHPRLRLAHRNAWSNLLRQRGGAPTNVPHRQWTTEYRCGGGLDPGHSGAVQPVTPPRPVIRRPPLLPQEVRCRQDPRSILIKDAG